MKDILACSEELARGGSLPDELVLENMASIEELIKGLKTLAMLLEARADEHALAWHSPFTVRLTKK